jgi:TRAP-type C4-dicarboxylate transport system substrate-binding protein
MGAQAQFVAFAEVYTALERGILDCGVTGADPAYGQRWYEVTEYMIGPLPTFTANHLVFNRKVWEELPADIQQILIEEGAKHELESLRLSPIQNLVGVPKNVATGLELIEFTPEINDFMVNEVVLKKVVPNWVKRAGGPDSDAVKLFNEKVAPIVGVTINSQGEVEGERCPSVCR